MANRSVTSVSSLPGREKPREGLSHMLQTDWLHVSQPCSSVAAGCPLLQAEQGRALRSWPWLFLSLFLPAASTDPARAKGYLKMFDIPPGARHVFIQEDEASPHFLGKCFSAQVWYEAWEEARGAHAGEPEGWENPMKGLDKCGLSKLHGQGLVLQSYNSANKHLLIWILQNIKLTPICMFTNQRLWWLTWNWALPGWIKFSIF